MSISASRCASGAFSLALSDVCLFVWSYSGLFVLFFILFYCCSLDCWFTTDRKDVDLDGRERGEDLEEVGGRETIIRICQIKTIYFQEKKNSMNLKNIKCYIL